MSKPKKTKLEGKSALPDALTLFVEAHLGPIESTSFRGWPHAESFVWCLKGVSGKTVYLKQHKQPRKFQQELSAYLAWTPHFRAGVPHLLTYCEDAPSALLLSEVPGQVVQDLRLTKRQALELYRQAGCFLRRFHTLVFQDTDPLSLEDALRQRLAAWAKRAEGLVDKSDIAWVQARVEEGLGQLGGLRRVPCHRDYTARNWLVSVDSGVLELSVIDFEHARPDLWLLDIERLYTSVWMHQPDLKDAFFEGYGHALSEHDEALLVRFAALGALVTLVWARDHGDKVFEAQGWRTLKCLQAEA